MEMLKGLKKLYYAILTKDDLTGVAYGAVSPLAGVNKASVKRKNNTDIFYAENGPWESATSKDVTSVELTVSEILQADYAALMGHTINGAEMIVNNNDIAPYVAIGIAANKSNGKSRYIWLYKGQFTPADEDHDSQGSSVKQKPVLIKADFLGHQFDGCAERRLDEESPNYVSGVATFFSSPLVTADLAVPTVTIVPLNAATAVAVTSAVNWTFNEAIQYSTVIASNFIVASDVAGTLVAGVLSVNAGRTVVTFTPTVNLSEATAHRAIVTSGVKDLAGNSLAASITKFTTA